ncbi:MAG: hypothetical protein ABIQ08_06670 [Duganella sp.]
MSKVIVNILAVIFLDNFYLTTGLWLILLASLVARRFFNFDYPYSLAISSWFFLVVTAGIVGGILAIDFFSHHKGMDRLTLVPYILGASPLFVSAILAAFMLPQK